MLKKISISGNEFTFVCSSANTRNGFKHVCELYKGERFLQRSTCNYLNRTWESYIYQSVIQQTVQCFIEELKFNLIENYKAENNVKRVKTEQKELIYSQSEELKLYNELYNTL